MIAEQMTAVKSVLATPIQFVILNQVAVFLVYFMYILYQIDF